MLAQRYRIVRAIKSGGMGAVYQAEDTRLNNAPCALKEMHEFASKSDSDFIRTKFEEEKRLLASLHHPGIPLVHDFFIIDSTCYIVMDLILGTNLEQELEDFAGLTGSAYPEMEVVEVALQILDVLDYLHRHKPPLVHRDVKPANMIREARQGKVWLVDFGLAATYTGAPRTEVGTLGYAPLEQMRGDAEPRSDLYALGATMHHMLTGKHPVPLSLPPVLKLLPEADPGLASIIDKAVRSEIGQRFRDAAEMVQAISDWKRQKTVPVVAATVPPTSLKRTQVGDRLKERYEVVRVVRSSETGGLYEVKDLNLAGKVRAAKEVLDRVGGDPLGRLQAEMQTLAQLSHPGIPQIIDFFQVGAMTWTVMDFVAGPNLAEVLEESMRASGRPLASRLVVADAVAVLDILSYLHKRERPVLHCDIKPANLIRNPASGRVMLVDFGLGKGRLSHGPWSAPEQVAGRPEPGSDLFSLGVTLYCLLSGKQLRGPIHNALAGFDARLSEILTKATQVRPEQRFRDAEAMQAALKDWLEQAAAALPERVVQTSRVYAVAAGLVALTVVAFAVGLGARGKGQVPPPAVGSNTPVVNASAELAARSTELLSNTTIESPTATPSSVPNPGPDSLTPSATPERAPEVTPGSGGPSTVTEVQAAVSPAPKVGKLTSEPGYAVHQASPAPTRTPSPQPNDSRVAMPPPQPSPSGTSGPSATSPTPVDFRPEAVEPGQYADIPSPIGYTLDNEPKMVRFRHHKQGGDDHDCTLSIRAYYCRGDIEQSVGNFQSMEEFVGRAARRESDGGLTLTYLSSTLPKPQQLPVSINVPARLPGQPGNPSTPAPTATPDSTSRNPTLETSEGDQFGASGFTRFVYRKFVDGALFFRYDALIEVNGLPVTDRLRLELIISDVRYKF